MPPQTKSPGYGPDYDGMIAFGGDYVTVIDLDPSNSTHWILHPKELIRTHPVWRGAPVGIKAAAWITRVRDSGDTTHAVLFTEMHVYISIEPTILLLFIEIKFALKGSLPSRRSRLAIFGFLALETMVVACLSIETTRYMYIGSYYCRKLN